MGGAGGPNVRGTRSHGSGGGMYPAAAIGIAIRTAAMSRPHALTYEQPGNPHLSRKPPEGGPSHIARNSEPIGSDTIQYQQLRVKNFQQVQVMRIRFFTGNSILGAGWGLSFAADDAEPSHHFAEQSPQPYNLINLIANAYNASVTDEKRLSLRAQRSNLCL
ncbi:MAG TPA: hypothetical protein VK463_20665 [Desulfomonilaceae bacterium]|nr:hypothetical protein [Desulfomonilaceae bacterium]